MVPVSESLSQQTASVAIDQFSAAIEGKQSGRELLPLLQEAIEENPEVAVEFLKAVLTGRLDRNLIVELLYAAASAFTRNGGFGD